MNNKLIAGLVLAACSAAAIPALAGDADMCLDCHEPAADWEGMSAEEVLNIARDEEIKRHVDNQELTDEQLQAIIAELMQP